MQRSFDAIPTSAPHTPLLDAVATPLLLRHMRQQDLPALCDELREYLLYSVGQTGGHFGAGLGVVELTVALHYVFDTPDDLIVWDVGHQAYPHKILTGRKDRFPTLRQHNGNIKRTADTLQISRTTLYAKMKKYLIDPDTIR